MPRPWIAAVVVLAAWGILEGVLIDADASRALTVVAGAAAPATLLALPRRPLASVAGLLGVLLATLAAGAHPDAALMPLGALLVASAGAGRWVGDRRRDEAMAGLAGIAAVGTLAGLYAEPDPDLRALPFFVAYIGATFVLGRTLRARAAERDDLQATRRRLERERERDVARAVATEREHIAAELHAIIASSVRRVAVGAARAQEELDTDPRQAIVTLRDVRGAASGALVETRRLLGLLRAEEAEYAPQPGLATLADRSTDRLDVRIADDGEALPAGLELAAFRIIEEALAAVPPGGRLPVRVDVRRTRDHLTFSVAVDGEVAPWSDADPAVAGMRERARLYGGEVRPAAADDGWVLRGRLPLQGVPA